MRRNRISSRRLSRRIIGGRSDGRRRGLRVDSVGSKKMYPVQPKITVIFYFFLLLLNIAFLQTPAQRFISIFSPNTVNSYYCRDTLYFTYYYR